MRLPVIITKINNKLNKIKSSTKKWPDTLINLTRHGEVKITRTHIGLTTHLMCRKPKPMYEMYLCELSVKHIFLECPTS